jgi:hypothetical protein
MWIRRTFSIIYLIYSLFILNFVHIFIVNDI